MHMLTKRQLRDQWRGRMVDIGRGSTTFTDVDLATSTFTIAPLGRDRMFLRGLIIGALVVTLIFGVIFLWRGCGS